MRIESYDNGAERESRKITRTSDDQANENLKIPNVVAIYKYYQQESI